MAFFTSTFTCKLDTKGRLVLPAKIKANLPETSANELVLKREAKPNLTLYPMVEYEKIHLRVSSLNDFHPEQRKLKRLFFMRIAQVELDTAGRILIPKMMLAHAQLEKNVTLIGMGNCIEIWNSKFLEKECMTDGDELSEFEQKYLGE